MLWAAAQAASPNSSSSSTGRVRLNMTGSRVHKRCGRCRVKPQGLRWVERARHEWRRMKEEPRRSSWVRLAGSLHLPNAPPSLQRTFPSLKQGACPQSIAASDASVARIGCVVKRAQCSCKRRRPRALPTVPHPSARAHAWCRTSYIVEFQPTNQPINQPTLWRRFLCRSSAVPLPFLCASAKSLRKCAAFSSGAGHE